MDIIKPVADATKEVAKDIVKELPIKDVTTNVLAKPSSEVGQGFGNLFWLVFSPIHAARAALEPRIEGYKKRIEEKVSKIPEDRLVNPPLNIVGPALEASRYHIEDEELQEMFASLIAASMDLQTKDQVHPSYVEVIKQLSSMDSNVLLALDKERNCPIGSIVAELNPGVHHTIKMDVIPFDEMNIETIDLYCSSVQNLKRLSLVEVDYTRNYMVEHAYDTLLEHPIMEQFKEEYNKPGKYPRLAGRPIVLQRGIWYFTTFGERFLKCCNPAN